MKPTVLKQLILDRMKAGIKRTLHIEGSPGGGKTSIPQQVADESAIGCMVIHAPLLQPEDYGFPVISADKQDVSFVVSRAKFPLVGSDCPETGILVIDELPQADASAQKILSNLLQAREIHGHRIKDGWMIVSTGNRVTDRAGANRLLSHLRNRITTVELETSLDDWTNWALKAGVQTEVIAFLRFKPDLLSDFNPQQEFNPTPRAWVEGVNAALGKVDPKVEFEVFKGDVGEGPAAEFVAFLKIYRNLPSPDAILMNPATADLPDDPATRYALCGALAHKSTEQNFQRALQYIQRMDPEFSVLYVRDVIRRKPSIQTTQAFVQWAATDGAKLLA